MKAIAKTPIILESNHEAAGSRTTRDKKTCEGELTNVRAQMHDEKEDPDSLKNQTT